jgi:hypothetical protein
MTTAPANMSPELLFMMQMFHQQSTVAAQAAVDPATTTEQRYLQQPADDLQRDNDSCREHEEQTAMLLASHLRQEDTQRVQAEAMIALQSQSHEALRTLADKVKRHLVQRPESARLSSIKLLAFDLKMDRSIFKHWRARWNMHLRAHKIHLIEDAKDRRECCLTELTIALSNYMLKWIANRDFSQQQSNSTH